MKVRIPRTDLTRFKEKAVNIETNQTIPILAFIKIEIENGICTVVKDNLKAFVISECPDTINDECSFLVHEKVLFKFLDFSESRFIKFEQGVNKIIISDDYSSVESPTEGSRYFRIPDLYPTTWTKISRDTLNSIGIVSKLIFSGEFSGPSSNVFVGSGHVIGSDGTIGYCGEMVEKMPNIVLSKNIAEIVSKLKYCQYSYGDTSYDYFGEDLITYGFKHSEIPFIDYTPFYGKIESDYSFKLPKKQIIDFCDLCLKTITSKKEIVAASFYPENKSLVFTMKGSDIKIESNIPVNKDNFKRFKFNPERMKVLLKAIVVDTVYFYPGENRYFITDSRKSFLSVIMGVKQ